MTDRDTITLPREVVQEVLEALEHAGQNHGGIYTLQRTMLRTALASEQPKQEHFAILAIACKDKEIDRLTDENEALRRDAERYRWLRGEHSRIDPCIKANAKYRLERDSSTWVNIHDLDAAIDAAMGDKT